jgi:hypothetical protein
MGKKEHNSEIYSKEQINRKFRKKSKKLEKREKIRKNKKKNKKERNEKRNIFKYIKKSFKENKQEIDITRLFEHCFDIDEIQKNVRKILAINTDAINEIPDLFKTMEVGRKEVNLAALEDKSVQHYLIKLMKNLKINSNVKNPFSFKITTLFRPFDPKKRITSDPSDIISECLSSYYHLVKALFEYENYMLQKLKSEEKEIEDNYEESQEENEDEGENAEEDEKFQDNCLHIKQIELKKLDEEKYAMDYEYELIENKLGKNTELINKAFNKIMQEDSKQFKIENKVEEDEAKLVGPPVPSFLANTLSLLNKDDESDDNGKDSLSNLFNKTTYTNKNKKIGPSYDSSTLNIEPINKISYDRIMSEERERMKTLAYDIQDYESKYRNTSLMEEHQKNLKNNKHKNMISEFDHHRDMNVTVDSKRALAIMKDKKGLEGRFESKDKYIGY